MKPEGGDTTDPIIVKETGGNFTYALAAGFFSESTLEGAIAYEPNVSNQVEAPEDLPQNVWSHLALTYDGARMRLFVDGELVASKASAKPITTKDRLAIGCLDSWEEGMTGKIDEVRIYDRALSEGEIQSDKASPLQIPPSGPVAAYSFDEGEGETVEDLTGDEHTATIHGASWSAHGRYGDALQFDAEEEDYVSIPASTGLDGNEELTVEAWVRPSESRFLGEIAMKEREGAGAAYSWTLDQHETEANGYYMQTEEGMVASGEETLPLGTWTHVAMTDDGAHNRLYVDGQLVDTEPAIPFDGHGEIRIGGNGIFGQYFDGRIDEVRIYDRALSEAEVQADKASPLQTPQKTPIAAYSFDEGEGEAVEDLTGDGHTATIEGAEWSTRGKYGGSMKFNGESMVTIPASEELNLTEEFTLEAWIKPEAGCEFGQIFVKEDAEEGHAAYVMAKHGSRLGAYLGIPGVEEESPPEALEANVWQYIAVTYDGGRARLYVNGQLVGSAPVAEILSTGGALRIGGSHIGSPGGDFTGKIDEVRIYNRALESHVLEDIQAPVFSPFFQVYASNSPFLGEPTVFLPIATDPPLPDGAAASGVESYFYRYKLDEQPFTAWASSPSGAFEVPGGTVGDTVKVEAYPADHAGNRGVTRGASVTIPPAEEGEEKELEELEEQNAEEFDGQFPPEAAISFSQEAGSSSKSALQPLDDPLGEFVKCEGRFSAPHYSGHADKKGEERINTVYAFICIGNEPIIYGHTAIALLYNGARVKPQNPGSVYFEGIGPRKKVNASAPCDRKKTQGAYRTVVTQVLEVEMNDLGPKRQKTTKYSGPVVNPCKY